MTEDFIHQSNTTAENAINLALHEIDSILQENGTTASNFGLPDIYPIATIHSQRIDFDIATEMKTATIQMAK
jgi:hypothetical protein